MKIQTLTPDEIQSLQVDSALRLLGTYSAQLVEVNQEISNAIIELGQAKMRVDRLKSDKLTLVELMRAMKVIIERA